MFVTALSSFISSFYYVRFIYAVMSHVVMSPLVSLIIIVYISPLFLIRLQFTRLIKAISP